MQGSLGSIVGQFGSSSALVFLVVLSVVAILRGWLVPRRSVDQLLSVQAERLTETRERELEWRRTAETLEAQGDLILESLKTVEALVRAIPSVSPRQD